MSMSSFLPAVHDPAYAMSMRIGSVPSSSMKTPLPGSLGSAAMGRIVAASISITLTYSASASLCIPSTSARARSGSMPRSSTRNSTDFSSAAMIPVKAPTSAAMFVIVARSSTPSASTAGPAYSMICPIAWPSRM